MVLMSLNLHGYCLNENELIFLIIGGKDIMQINK